MVRKNFWFEKKKKNCPKKNFSPKKIFGPNNFFYLKTFLLQIKCEKKNVVKKKFLV